MVQTDDIKVMVAFDGGGDGVLQQDYGRQDPTLKAMIFDR